LAWYELQYKFLTSHQYFTDAALSTREKKKLQNIEEVKELLSKN